MCLFLMLFYILLFILVLLSHLRVCAASDETHIAKLSISRAASPPSIGAVCFLGVFMGGISVRCHLRLGTYPDVRRCASFYMFYFTPDVSMRGGCFVDRKRDARLPYYFTLMVIWR